MLSNIAPFFIVEELGPSVAFYVRAGFDVRYSAPAQDPFFAIVGRDETRIFLKAITGDVLPLPNPIRHHWAPWDAFVSVEQPDTLAAEFAEANIAFHKELKNTDDGLRGFEVRDNDGYVCLRMALILPQKWIPRGTAFSLWALTTRSAVAGCGNYLRITVHDKP